MCKTMLSANRTLPVDAFEFIAVCSFLNKRVLSKNGENRALYLVGEKVFSLSHLVCCCGTPGLVCENLLLSLACVCVYALTLCNSLEFFKYIFCIIEIILQSLFLILFV